MDVTLRLERGIADIGWARHELHAFLREAGLERDPYAVGLVVSELVTNAMLHGRGAVDLRVRTTAGHALRIDMYDCKSVWAEFAATSRACSDPEPTAS